MTTATATDIVQPVLSSIEDAAVRQTLIALAAHIDTQAKTSKPLTAAQLAAELDADLNTKPAA
jgi:hypothetical protein